MVTEASRTALRYRDEALSGQWARERGTWQRAHLVRGRGRVAQKQVSNREEPEANGKTDRELWVQTLTAPLAPDNLGLSAFPLCALVFCSVKWDSQQTSSLRILGENRWGAGQETSQNPGQEASCPFLSLEEYPKVPSSPNLFCVCVLARGRTEGRMEVR